MRSQLCEDLRGKDASGRYNITGSGIGKKLECSWDRKATEAGT